eukprot:CAMPEP_0177739190 /NCGR_PEP_ID=MMETSP0484_2-20121128/26878_1 /TAXON_ID=354590 /ORGANISM="Rhodomonas lens, Strain RHODO" /LENGTH=34 /DNA_ID= /DNA_START= /DNA_END= /DNA_ORIENTATION=
MSADSPPSRGYSCADADPGKDGVNAPLMTAAYPL